MDAKIVTGVLLWVCFIASLSISQTASATIDSRPRFRRQSDEVVACPEGTKPCPNENGICASFCNGTAECADGFDELDCATNAPATLSPTASVPIAASSESSGVEIERVDLPQTTTEEASNTDPSIALLDKATTIANEAAATDAAAPAVVTGQPPASAAVETTVADAAVGTSAAPAAATIADAVSDAAAGATSAAPADATGTVAPSVEAVTGEGSVTNDTADGSASTGGITVEVSTVAGADNGTDSVTTVNPGPDQVTADENSTAIIDSASTNSDATTVETITVDSNATIVADNETTTDAGVEVTTLSSNETEAINGTDASSDAPIATTIVLDTSDADGNGTQSNGTEEATTPTPVTQRPADRVELRVIVQPEVLAVQYGQSYELTCTVYGADASTTIYWIQEEPERRYAQVDATGGDDKQVGMSQVALRSRITIDDMSKVGKYTCMAQDAAGNSGSAILTIQQGYNPRPTYPVAPGPNAGSGYLRIVAPDMADGEYVEIQCEGASPEDEGRIQWFFNNRLINDEQPLYPRGKTLHIRPISRPYLGSYRCSIPGSSYADANSVVTFGGAPQPGPVYGGGFSVSVEIAQGQAGQGQAQAGSRVVLIARPSEQATRFHWTFTSGQGTVDRGYSDQLIIPQASSQDSGTYTCEVISARGESARGSTNLYVAAGPVTGRCGIDEATCRNGRCIPRSALYDGKDDCGDGSDEGGASSGGDHCQPSEIRCANSDRGRKCVQKFWMCDGDRDCDDGSDEDQRYCALLPRQRYCKPSEYQCGGSNGTSSSPVCIPRSFACDGYNDCPDRSDELGCVKPTVVSAPQRQIQINIGQTLTIQCTARGSPPPFINWRLNWGHVCGDGSDTGRCDMGQAIDPNDPSIVTGTLTVRNVKPADAGAYSCEALNNQGFIFATPDAIVEVIYGPATPSPGPSPCDCNGHSSYCSPDGRCQNCQHNTAGYHCEFCAPGYQGDARRGTPYDCQPTGGDGRCDPSGTHMESGGRCICKYNVEGDRCDRCKSGHFYLNPTTPSGCLPCFCSGTSTECTSTSDRRHAVAIPLSGWNVVPKNFATDRYEAGSRIQERNGGQELALDQSSLGRPANDVLYWKAPKSALGDRVTLYDGNIEIQFTNDGNGNEAANSDEFIWLRGNNIDLVHKLPSSQRFEPNTDASYSVAVNERTFTRKDGTHIDRENILMALSDLDTFLVKINPIGGRRNAVLRGVTLNVADRNGQGNAAPTVESCRCPANYTGASCEKCAEGYGRPHPLVGIYLGQCWSCRSLCHDRSDRCDRETGKCHDCQGNSEGDRCERCRAGYVLDARLNQCVREDYYGGYQPQQPSGSGTRGSYYIDNQSYDSYGGAPLTIVLDGNQPEQRIPLQVLTAPPQSVVWGRTDGSPLPSGVWQEGNDLVFRNPSAEQGGNYICTITHPDGSIERIAAYLEYRPGPAPPRYDISTHPSAGPVNVVEGADHFISAPTGYHGAQWRRSDGQGFPAGVYQDGDGLRFVNARPEHSGTYYCEATDANGRSALFTHEIRVPAGGDGGANTGPPRIKIEPRTIRLKEGQRMIVQYTVSSHDPIEVIWNKKTPEGLRPIPSTFVVERNRLTLTRATLDASGVYQVLVSNPHGRDQQELEIIVEPRRGRGRGQQAAAPQVVFTQDQYDLGYGETVDIRPRIHGETGATMTWSKDGSPYLPEGITAFPDGTLRVTGRSNQIDGRYIIDVANAYGRTSASVFIRWREPNPQYGNYGESQDQPRHYINVRLEASDAQSHQIGRDISLYCAVQGGVEQPYEYQYTKDGQPVDSNVEVHPGGQLIIRNAQANDAGHYRCVVSFPRAPEVGTQESSYDLRIEGHSDAGHDHGDNHHHHQQQQHGGEHQSHGEHVEARIEPSEATVERGQKVNLTCVVKGTQHYTVTWTKYAHDRSLPSYAHQEGNSVIVAPTDDAVSEQMYLHCAVKVPGQSQSHDAYAQVSVRGNDASHKKKKKRRS